MHCIDDYSQEILKYGMYSHRWFYEYIYHHSTIGGGDGGTSCGSSGAWKYNL